MVDNLDIKQNLINIGLEEIEAEIYITLLNYEELTVLELCKKTQVPRTTVYRICESLINKKFATWVVKETGKTIKAIRPKHLDFLIQQKKSELETYTESLSELQKMVEVLPTQVPKTQVRYYQGKEGIQQIMWNALKAKKETIGYSIFGRIEVVGKSFIDKYNEEFYLRKLIDRVIINNSVIPRTREFVMKGSLHLNDANIRVIDDKDFYIAGDTVVYNNIFAVSFWKEGEIVGVEIENSEIAKIQKGIFEVLWKTSKTLEEVL